MTGRYDVIVVGVGGMGSAACYHLARRGVRVLGIERFTLGHDRGSSHGQTRVIRRAYFEHPDYVPLLNRAYQLWDELSQEAGEVLFPRTGLLLCGPPGSELLEGVRRTAVQHGLDIAALTGEEAARRFPAFCVPPGHDVLFEADAGYLRVEASVRAHAALAERHGAALWTSCSVRSFSFSGGAARVETDRGTVEAGALVVCGGAFSAPILKDLALPLTVLRKVLLWYDAPDPRLRRDAGFPVFLASDDQQGGDFYGFPVLPGVADGEGLKVAEHSGGEPLGSAERSGAPCSDDPLAVDRSLRPADPERCAAFLRRYVPSMAASVAAGPRRHDVCLYTMTPDGDFIVDRHPEQPALCYAAGFSGHGFKFASVMGEALADLATQGRTDLPIGFLRRDRFSR